MLNEINSLVGMVIYNAEHDPVFIAEVIIASAAIMIWCKNIEWKAERARRVAQNDKTYKMQIMGERWAKERAAGLVFRPIVSTEELLLKK